VLTNISAFDVLNGGDGLGGTNSLNVSGGAAFIGGNLSNESLGSVTVVNNGKLVVGGTYNNAGTFSMSHSVGTFVGAVVNSGAWITDPSTNTFQSTYTLTGSGSISMSAGDVYIFSNSATTVGNFINNSTQSNTTSMLAGKFVFNNSTLAITQLFGTAGINIGNLNNPSVNTGAVYVSTLDTSILGQYSNNFALGTLDISGTSTTEVFGSSGVATNSSGLGAALFLVNLDIDPGAELVISNGVQVYFQNSNDFASANYELEPGAGLHVELVPEPSTLLLCLCGLGILYVARCRLVKKTSEGSEVTRVNDHECRMGRQSAHPPASAKRFNLVAV